MDEVPDTKLVKGDQQGVARKRLRSTSGGSAVAVKAEHGEKPSSKSSRNEKGSTLVHPEKVQPEVSPTDLKKVRHPFTRFSNYRLCLVCIFLLSHIISLSFRMIRSKVVSARKMDCCISAVRPLCKSCCLCSLIMFLQSSSPFLGRRFSDAAANVPIKKRRIQLEMARSPSPPPGSLKPEPGIAAVHEVPEITKPSGSQILVEVNVTMATESDGSRGGSHESFAAAQVQKFDSEAPAAALNISDEDLAKGVTQMNPPERAPGTDPEVGFAIAQSPRLGPLDLIVGCKGEKGDDESQLRTGNRCVTENGTTSASTRRKEESSLVSQVPTCSPSPTTEGAQACAVETVVMSEHLFSSGLSMMGRAGQSEDVLLDLSREGGVILSSNSKRKFSETDMSHSFLDHLGVEESCRSRPVNRAGNVNLQTSIAGSTAEEHVHTLAPHTSAMMETSTLVGKNNTLRDDRLHWDLNMDMEEWERPSEEDNAVTMAQNLSSIPDTEVEKMESVHAKKFDQESQKGDSGVARTSFEDGRLEEKRPPQDSVDAICEFSAAEVSGASLKSEVQVERKDEISLTPSDACNASFKLAEDQSRETFSSIPSGGIADTHIVEEHDFTESEPEVVCNSLQGDKSNSALQKDKRYTELEVAPAPEQEAEPLHCDEPPSVVSPIVDKETKGRVFLVAEKDRMDSDVCSSEPTDIRADTSFVHEEEDSCGIHRVTLLADTSSELADPLHSEKLGSHGENLSQLFQSEESVISTHETTTVVPVAEFISIRNITELQGCDDFKGAPHDDENAIDKEVVEEFTTDRSRLSTSPSRQPAPLKWEGDTGEDLEAEDVDYGDSDLREGDDHDVEDRLQRGAAEVESTWNSYVETKIPEVQGASASQIHRDDADDFGNVMGTRKRRYGGEITSAEEFQGMGIKKAHAVLVDDSKCGSIPEKRSISLEINGGLVVEEVIDRDATVSDIVHLR